MPNDKRNKLARFISDYSPQDGKAKAYVEQLERAANSRFMTKTINRVTGEHERAKPKTSNSYMKSILSRINPPDSLVALPPGDQASAFDSLLTLPGFEKCKKEFARLWKAIELWQEQGADLREKCTGLHVVIFSKDEKIATEFAKHYHAFLTACGVFAAGQALARADGAKLRSMWSIDVLDGGMCLIVNAKELSFHGAKVMGSTMQSQNVVIVANYAGESERLHSSLERNQFFLHLRLVDEKPDDPVQRLQDALESCIAKKYDQKMSLEGTFHGPWAETFAKRVLAKTSDKDESKIKARVEKELDSVAERQHARLLNSEAGNPEPDPCWISREDLLGEEPTLKTFNTVAWKELQEMSGLEEVKQSIESFANGVLLDYHRAMYGQKPARSGLCRLFIGPPGTGKLMAHVFESSLNPKMY